MIREVSRADAAAIAEIYNVHVTDTDVSFETEPLTTEQMADRIMDMVEFGFPYFVWEEDGKVLGFCYAHSWKERAAYAPALEASLYLAPEAQGKGIGQIMLQELIERCRKAGVVSLIACITATNEHSIALCRKLGFEQASYFRKVGRKHGRLLDVVDYQLML